MHYISCLDGVTDFEDSKKILADKGLVIKEYDNLYLIKYRKDSSNMNDEDVLKCRGLILEKNTNKLVCVPPTKSIDIDYYHNLYKNNENNNENNIIFEEFIDGTMINLFKFNDKVYISTRSCIGANCRWNSSNTFNILFNECIDFSKFDNIEEGINLSFVIQHPDNTIVKKYVNPNIKLCFAIKIKDNTAEILNRQYMSDILEKFNLNIDLPIVYDLNSMEETYKKIDTLDETEQGIILKQYSNNSDKRSKIRNINYNKIRFLRGNTNNKQYLYFELRKNQNVNDYLEYFPEDKDFFDECRFKLYNVTSRLFNYYRDLKVNKIIKFLEIDYEYRPLINELHSMYQTDNKVTTKQKIIEYLHRQDTPRILFILNYKTRSDKKELLTDTNQTDNNTNQTDNNTNQTDNQTDSYVSYASVTK